MYNKTNSYEMVGLEVISIEELYHLQGGEDNNKGIVSWIKEYLFELFGINSAADN